MGKVITYEEVLWNRYKKLIQERDELTKEYNALKAKAAELEAEAKKREVKPTLKVVKK